MADSRKASTARAASDDDDDTPLKDTIRATARKETVRPNGTVKLKRPAPKHNKPGNWRDGSVVDDEKKRRTTGSPSTNSATSPGPVVTLLEDSARDTFATGRPLEDSPETILCKHCKKSILKSIGKAHIEKCLAEKREAVRKRKEAKERAARKKEEEGREEEREKEGKEKKGKKEKEKDKEKKEKEKEKKETVPPVDADGDTNMGNDEEEEEADGPEEAVSPEVVKKTPAGLKSTKKTAGKKNEDGEKKQGKKRKAEGDAEKMPKQKKKKDDPKVKTAKPKVPVDVERQCGVITPNGLPCARSLTCKSHSMGAKRAVPGRSLPYDMLLTAYQKKNQAKQQKAAIDANAPLEDEDDANAGPIDSDEETALVMSALSKWNPQPVVPQPVLIPIKLKYQLARLREQLDNATSGGTVNIFKVASKNGEPFPARDLPGDEDAPGERDESYAVGGGGAGAQGLQGVRRQSGFVGQTPVRPPVSISSNR